MSSPKEPDFSAKQSREIPDLYRLLSLAPLESNSEKIETRIARLRRKAEELQETNPRKAKHANKLAKVATAQLLSAEKKAAYDEIWARTYGRNEPKLTDDVLDQAGESLERVGTKSPTTTAAVECNAGTTALQDQAEPLTEAWQNFEGLLPSGSHSQAFDLPEYLENAHSSYDDAELDRLLEALTAQANGDETNPLDHHTASFEPAAPQPPFALNSNTPPKPLAKSLKSRRRRTWLGPLIGLFACLAMVMGLVAFLVGPGSQRSKDSESDDPLATAARRTNDAPLAPRRSGLPQVGGFGGPNGSGTRIALTPADGPTMPSETPFESSANESTDAMNAPYDSTSSGTTPPAKMPPDSPENTEPTIDIPGKNAPPTTPMPQVAAAVAAVGDLASKYDYEAARGKVDALKALPLSDEQESLIKKAGLFLDLASEAHSALVTQVTSMQAGETFLVGSSAQIAFVEADQEQLSIRLRGNTRKYEYSQLPPGILYSLLNLSLDRINARALAARGAFIALQPNRSSRTLSKAREYLVQAETSDNSLTGLSTVLEALTATE